VDGTPRGRAAAAVIKGEAKLVDVCREHDLKQSEVKSWMEIFVNAGERGLKARADDERANHDREVAELRAKGVAESAQVFLRDTPAWPVLLCTDSAWTSVPAGASAVPPSCVGNGAPARPGTVRRSASRRSLGPRGHC
jgi:hypothetical protein